MSQKLQRKDAELFRTVVNCFEQKQFKRGLKAADSILKRHPNHGETLAMKGIILNSMGKKSDAFDFVKLGLRNDVKSPICWHVFGLLYKSEGNHKEAAKCYLNALRIEPENQNILRDLSWLQIQTKDFNGFLASRKRMLELKPSSRGSWVAYAIACHYSGDHKRCIDVIDKYFESSSSEVVDPFEDSELRLFQNKEYEKCDMFNEGLDHLNLHAEKIIDKHGLSVQRARLLLLRGDHVSARDLWQTLLQEQPDNIVFHIGLQSSVLLSDRKLTSDCFSSLTLPVCILTLNEEQKINLREAYSGFPYKSRFCAKVRLLLSAKHQFLSELKSFIEDSLLKGYPSLFDDIEFLMNFDREMSRRDYFSHIISMLDGLLQESSFPVLSFWARYLKSLVFVAMGNYRAALTQIDLCIEHTPTSTDAYLRKSEILEKIGEFTLAAETANDCRLLDLQDRYLNNCATKFYLRAEQVTSAQETIYFFTKHDGDPDKTLQDLQCSWYITELAESYSRQKQWKNALNRFKQILDSFNSQANDLFDFHSYCIRKSTLRSYVETTTTIDQIYAHKIFQKASRSALTVYLHLVDCPEDVDGLGHLSAAERKKERAKLRKRKGKDDEGEDGKENENVGDINLSNCLNDALEWSKKLETCISCCECETLSILAELHIRRNKPLPALRALAVGYLRDKLSPEINSTMMKLFMRMKNKKFSGVNDNVLSQVRNIIQEIFSVELTPSGIGKFVNEFVNAAAPLNSLPHLTSAIKCQLLLDRKLGYSKLESLQPNDLLETSNYSQRHWQEFCQFLKQWDIEKDLLLRLEKLATFSV